jgi:predicted MFS family arabinose efflux permease
MVSASARAVSVRTYSLGLGAFAVGTSAYCIAGLVPELSAHLAIAPGRAGQLVTVFAWTCVVAGPLLTSLTQRVDQRRILMAALLVTATGNAVAMLAPDFGWMVAARIVAAIGTAVYTPGAIVMAAQLNAPAHRARSLAVVFGGLTIALIIGVPLATGLSPHVGVRGVLFGLVLLCVLAAAAIEVVIPSGGSAPIPVSMRDRIAGLTDSRIRAVLAVAMLASTSMFAVYIYLAPLLDNALGASGITLSLLLAGYGVGAAVGNVLGGQIADRLGPRIPLLIALSLCAMLLAALPAMAMTISGAMVTLALWGCAFWSMNAPLGAWLILLSAGNPERSPLVVSLNQAAIYLGMGCGGALGAGFVSLAGIGWLAPLAAIISVAAIAMLCCTCRTEHGGTAAIASVRPIGTAP